MPHVQAEGNSLPHVQRHRHLSDEQLAEIATIEVQGGVRNWV